MRLAAILIVFAILSACTTLTPQNPVPLTKAAPAGPLERYEIAVGDLLDIKFFYNPELNESVTVRPDGKISLQLANEVAAAGRTPEELRAALVERYAKEVNKPEIAVILRSFANQRVYIDGEVARPGMLPVTGPVTLLQSIAAAGGFRDTALRSQVIIIRRGPDAKIFPIVVNADEIITGRSPADPALVPFDIVFVPRSAIANVNQWVDLYIRRNIPIGTGLGIGWTVE